MGVGIVIGVLLAAEDVSAQGRQVTFHAQDGQTVSAVLTEARQRPAPGAVASAEAAPAVVLVGMLGRSKADWYSTAALLAAANITSVAIDLRGSQLPEDGTGASWHIDVVAAVSFLIERPDVRPWAIGVAGASLGANLAATAASVDPRVRSIALISPSLDYRGIRIEAALRQYAERPALLVASLRDPYAARSARELAADAPGVREIQWAETAAHGTMLLAREPDVVRRLVEWFQRTLQ